MISSGDFNLCFDLVKQHRYFIHFHGLCHDCVSGASCTLLDRLVVGKRHSGDRFLTFDLSYLYEREFMARSDTAAEAL